MKNRIDWLIERKKNKGKKLGVKPLSVVVIVVGCWHKYVWHACIAYSIIHPYIAIRIQQQHDIIGERTFFRASEG